VAKVWGLGWGYGARITPIGSSHYPQKFLEGFTVCPELCCGVGVGEPAGELGGFRQNGRSSGRDPW
jgi:hypothetical protein